MSGTELSQMAELQRFETLASFECPKCGQHAQCKVAVPEPNWGAAESMSDLTSEDPTEVICNHCLEVFEAYVFNSAGGCDITLDDYPNTHVVADMAFFSPPVDNEWIDQLLSDDPASIFMETYHQTLGLLAANPDLNGGHILNRMAFTQLVSALEAYLGDTLINEVTSRSDSISRLLAADKDLRERKFSLPEFASKPNLVMEEVTRYLRAVLYHNIPKVDFLYRTALSIDILYETSKNADLLQAVKYRHDCVHRNGADVNGNRLYVFTRDYVEKIAELLRDLVEKVEGEIDDSLPF